ncbi:hypothetical protein [Tissierella sp. P1]|uniref:hypothetical protein n=1 Tax=Tissierella sp. P1 TaxID=1280483 RepID=UPI001911FE05|nr:hypothetical protein [Tissierella sp. P1]
MIPFDFEYYKPTTVEEAIELFNNLISLGKKPYIMEAEQNLYLWRGCLIDMLMQ